MTTPSGTIGLSDVNAELGYSPTAVITMNDAAVRTLGGAGGSGTTITMNQLRGKSNRVTITLTIASDTANYDVYSSVGPSYDPGKTDVYVTINPGVNVYSNSTGSSAFSVPGSFNPADTVTITNNGVIVGRGGNGGYAYYSSNPTAGPGSSGGPGLSVSFPTTIANNNRIAGGGGGGGGGGAVYGNLDRGGGGGGGVSFGSGGGSNGPNGNPGTVSSAGTGGPGQQNGPDLVGAPGGPGGGYGSAGTAGGTGVRYDPGNPYPNYYPGGSGGASGSAITGNSYITWTANGTKNGPVS